MKTLPAPHVGVAGLLATAFLTSVVFSQNVGIGTTTPQSKLSVNGSTASGGIAVGDASYTSTLGTVAPLNGALIQGDMGIGTTAPTAKLDVEDGNIELSQSFALRWGSNDTGERIYSDLDVGAPGFNDLFIESRQGIFFVADTNDTSPSGNYGFVWSANSSWQNGVPLELMRLSRNGNLGIGDTDPTEAKLVVRGSVVGSGGTNQRFTSASNGLVTVASLDFNASIYASNAIVAEGSLIAGSTVVAASSLTFSDSRLKNVKSVSDSATDLETLKKIEITDYTMKDASALGAGTFKKVIAQQVEEAYPQAVSKGYGYLPDVLAPGVARALGDGLFEIRLDAPHGLETGTKVKLLDAFGEAEYVTVEAAGGESFTARLKRGDDGGKVFVHGRQVGDLRTVDYDALSMLNISATQELAKKVAALEAENALLTENVADLEAANEKLVSVVFEVEELKRAVAALRAQDEGATLTVSTAR